MSYRNDFNDRIYIKNFPCPDQITDGSSEFTWENRYAYKKSKRAYPSIKKLNISDKEYIPSPKDKIYFYPGCDVPRYKVRDWAAKNNAAVTITLEKATASFVSDKTIGSCYSYEHCMRVGKNSVILFLEANYDVNAEGVKPLHDYLMSSEENYVYLSDDYRYGNKSVVINGLSQWQIQRGESDRGVKIPLNQFDTKIQTWYSMTYITANNQKVLDSLEQDAVVYPQEAIMQLLNAGATIIDQDMYKSLKVMLESKSSADHLVAIEVMANCNVDPSLHHLLLLFQQHGDTIRNLRESKHINFKSLLKYIGLDRNSMCYISDDQMVELLMDKDQLTMQVVKELAEGVKENWKDNYNSEHFKIKTITVSDEIKAYFKNKEEQQQADAEQLAEA